MKRLVSAFVVLSLIWAAAGPVSASFIGDTVTVGRAYPTIDSITNELYDVTVETGDGDVVIFSTFDVNIEDTYLTVTFTAGNYYYDRVFNGLVIRGIDDYITSVDVETNLSGWDDSRIIFTEGNDYVGFDWSDLGIAPGTDFNAMFEFGPNPIPIPTTAVLFVTGLIGFALIRRKKVED